MKFGAIILAGGEGRRFQGKKQFVIFKGKPLWEYVLDKVLHFVDRENIVVVGVDVQGGSTRTKSVFSGIKALNNQTERVIILEAARPLVTIEQIRTLLEDKALSASFVAPLVNTVIGRDASYLNRDELYELLTPQAFNFKLLKEAYDSNAFTDITDETRIMFEFHGIKPHFIETSSNLFKVTYPGDLDIIESISKSQSEECE